MDPGRHHPRRVGLTAAAAMLLALGACGGGETAVPTPAPTGTAEITGRIMGPADKTQDTVDQLNDLQERRENSGY